jgi:hypothetical protein
VDPYQDKAKYWIRTKGIPNYVSNKKRDIRKIVMHPEALHSFHNLVPRSIAYKNC